MNEIFNYILNLEWLGWGLFWFGVAWFYVSFILKDTAKHTEAAYKRFERRVLTSEDSDDRAVRFKSLESSIYFAEMARNSVPGILLFLSAITLLLGVIAWNSF